MIKEINIKNFALVENGSLTLDSNLNLITGESASGKSLILKSILFALGKKISPDPIRKPAEWCEVSLSIDLDVTKHKKIINYLKENDLYDSNEIILRRKFGARNNFYINDTPCAQHIVKFISDNLFEIVSQHESRNLIDPKYQLDLIDELVKPELLLKYKTNFTTLSQITKEKESIQKKMRDRDDNLSFLEFKLKEIKDLNLKEEDIKLDEKISFLENFKFLNENLNELEDLLMGETLSLNIVLDLIKKKLNILSKKITNSTTFQESFDILSKIEVLTEDLTERALSPREDLNKEDEDLEALYKKAQAVKKIKQKYSSIEAILAKQLSLEDEISALKDLDITYSSLLKEEKKALELIKISGAALSEERVKVSKKLEKDITAIINELNMPNAIFKIELKNTSATEHGFESVSFLIKPNTGSDFQPTAKIASGGELSRITLAIYCCINSKNSNIFIFDEIDTGIGGNTAIFLAKKIKQLSQNNQIISITHSPQIAVFASNHIKIEKITSKNNTISEITLLSTNEARAKEIARMLGDSLSPDASKKLAYDLIKNAT